MKKLISEETLRKLFTKDYGDKPPSTEEWSRYYAFTNTYLEISLTNKKPFL